MKRLLNAHIGIAVALGLVVSAGAAGAYFVSSSYDDIRAERPAISLDRLRRAFVGLAELERFVGEIAAISETSAPTEAQRRELARRLDIVYVRLNEFERDEEWATLASSQRLIRPIRSIIARVDGLVRTNFEGLADEKPALRADLRAAGASLIGIANTQHRIERASVERQTLQLQRMVVGTSILIALFAAVSAIVLVLLRAERIARAKVAAAEAQARHLAYFDLQTELPNRAYLSQKAAQEIGADAEPAVAIIDLDDFKLVNDAYGHSVGDKLLFTIAERLKRIGAEHDAVVARLGGDEFAVMLPQTIGEQGLRAFCRQAIARLREPALVGGVEIAPRMSIGAVLGRDDRSSWTLGPLLKSADKALLAAKAQGKNDFALFDEALRQELLEEEALLAGIDDAIENDDLFLVFQPQVDMTSGRIVGTEALVRWRRGDAVAPPGLFIDAAEKSGKIRNIDYAVLEKAATALSTWRAAGVDAPAMSVNLSAAHFSDNTIVDRVDDILHRYGFPPSLLTLEITETMLLDDWDRVETVIASLHGLGVKLALDDFGTGYSSIGYLRRLCIDELKIDRSMLAEVETSPQTRTVLSTMADLAEAFSMCTVVEGVETAAQAARLRDLGFSVAQGYLYSPPVSEAQAGAWLAEDRRLTAPERESSAA